MFLNLTVEQEDRLKIMDKLLATLDPAYVAEMWEQLRIMGVLKNGSAGDPEKDSSIGVFFRLVQHFEDQNTIIERLETKLMELENDMRSSAKILAALIPADPKDPRTVASSEYGFFSKYGQYP